MGRDADLVDLGWVEVGGDPALETADVLPSAVAPRLVLVRGGLLQISTACSSTIPRLRRKPLPRCGRGRELESWAVGGGRRGSGLVAVGSARSLARGHRRAQAVARRSARDAVTGGMAAAAV
jgi:hypothetical protein